MDVRREVTHSSKDAIATVNRIKLFYALHPLNDELQKDLGSCLRSIHKSTKQMISYLESVSRSSYYENLAPEAKEIVQYSLLVWGRVLVNCTAAKEVLRKPVIRSTSPGIN